jgi:hypothetical protein
VKLRVGEKLSVFVFVVESESVVERETEVVGDREEDEESVIDPEWVHDSEDVNECV